MTYKTCLKFPKFILQQENVIRNFEVLFGERGYCNFYRTKPYM